ncbi:unnamed protein product [Closterium sp. NIES-54]
MATPSVLTFDAEGRAVDFEVWVDDLQLSSCEAEIYAGAMAAQELRWLTYLLTDLGEQPRSPPVLYVDNKSMLALCREHRLEHRTKHIALRYFLARELQQRGQLRLAYVASAANTADIFTKALAPGDHQCFCTLLGFPTFSHCPNCPARIVSLTLPCPRYPKRSALPCALHACCPAHDLHAALLEPFSARALPELSVRPACTLPSLAARALPCLRCPAARAPALPAPRPLCHTPHAL